MKKKIIGIFVCTLLIIPALQTFGTMSKNITPNDPDFEKQWFLNNTGQYMPNSGEGTPDADIDALKAWDIETGSSDIIIATIDCGIDYNHPDLADNIWINDDEIPDNGLDDDNNGYIDDIHGWNFYDGNNDLLDHGGHGTIHAGVIAAVGNNGVGIAGICWHCKIMPLHCIDEWDEGERSNVALGIRYAVDNGAKVISMTFGDTSENPQITEAVDYAYSNGVVMTASACNEGNSKKRYPAAYENVIGVGFTDNKDTKADLTIWTIWGPYHMASNYGEWVDVAGPGVDIYTTMPTYEVSYNSDLGLAQNYDYISGSSLSAPITAGIAGLLLSRNPQLTPDQVQTIICNNVDPYISDVYIGTGRINAYKALISSNIAPKKPTITGDSSGKADIENKYSFISIDPEEDEISYYIDWGDNTSINWTSALPSGAVYTSLHTWSEKGSYTIKAKAKDTYGAESEWSTFDVNITKSKSFTFLNIFDRFFQRFPFFEKILKQ